MKSTMNCIEQGVEFKCPALLPAEDKTDSYYLLRKPMMKLVSIGDKVVVVLQTVFNAKSSGQTQWQIN